MVMVRTSRRLVALVCLGWAPAFAAGQPEPHILIPAEPAVGDAAPDEFVDTLDLNLLLPTGAVKELPVPHKKAKTAAAKTKQAPRNDGPITLGQGALALNLSTPQPSSNLSSGASLNLDLPTGALKAEAKAAVGKDDGDWNAFWHKDSAHLRADLNGPLGTALSVTGENALSLNYRTAESIGAADSTTHVVRTEDQTGKVDLTVPVKPVQVTLGGESSRAHTEDTSRDKAATISAAVRTTDHTLYARAAFSPLDGVSVEGGAAARVSNISWQEETAKSASFQSLDPHLSVTMSPWRDTQISAKVEHVVSPYDAAAFATYSRAESGIDGSGFQPDHAWQMEARLQQSLGPASLAATYTAARSGTVTEFAQVSGVQAPATTPLLNRESVAVSLSLPLTEVGIPRTDISSEARWQSSRVIDPITQKPRAASGETPQSVSVKLSHSLPAGRLSFGLTGEYRGGSTSYQVSELSTTADSGSLGAFLAYKPGPYEINLNLDGLAGGTTKDEYYRGLRGDSLIGRTSVQDNSGPMLKLSLQKAF